MVVFHAKVNTITITRLVNKHLSISKFKSLQTIGYTHLTVNHSLNFVDPETGANTQSIERTWRSARAVVPTAGRRSTNMVGYLGDFQFRRIYPDVTTRLHHFFTHLSAVYEPESSITSTQTQSI